MSHHLYAPEEDAIIREQWPTHTGLQIQQQFLPHRRVDSIQGRAVRLGIPKEQIVYERTICGQQQTACGFTPEEDEIIHQMYPTHTAREMQKHLPGHPFPSIHGRAAKLGVQKNVLRANSAQAMKYFTPEEDEIIHQMYPTHTATAIQKQMPHRKLSGIYSRAQALGVQKDRNAIEQAISLSEVVLDEMPIIMEPKPKYKKCVQCEKIKAVASFPKNRTRPDGFHDVCKLCRNKERREKKTDSQTPMTKEVVSVQEGYRWCPQCEQEKLLAQFSRSKSHKDGYQDCCKNCDKLRKARKYSYESNMLQLIKRKYGLTPDEYFKMVETQGNVCACCRQPETSMENGRTRRLAIDHCHVTGAVRGLLCQSCNQALGLLGEDPDRVKALLEYVEDRCLW